MTATAATPTGDTVVAPIPKSVLLSNSVDHPEHSPTNSPQSAKPLSESLNSNPSTQDDQEPSTSRAPVTSLRSNPENTSDLKTNLPKPSEQITESPLQHHDPSDLGTHDVSSNSLCEACGISHDRTYGSGRFCSVHCARRIAASRKWEKQRSLRKRAATNSTSLPSDSICAPSRILVSSASTMMGTSMAESVRQPAVPTQSSQPYLAPPPHDVQPSDKRQRVVIGPPQSDHQLNLHRPTPVHGQAHLHPHLHAPYPLAMSMPYAPSAATAAASTGPLTAAPTLHAPAPTHVVSLTHGHTTHTMYAPPAIPSVHAAVHDVTYASPHMYLTSPPPSYSPSYSLVAHPALTPPLHPHPQQHPHIHATLPPPPPPTPTPLHIPIQVSPVYATHGQPPTIYNGPVPAPYAFYPSPQPQSQLQPQQLSSAVEALLSLRSKDMPSS